PRVVGVANPRRALAAPEGIAPADALSRLWDEGGKPGLEAPLGAVTNSAADVRVIVDATAAQEVAAHHRRWLARGLHVVSANKLALGGALADWDALQSAAEATGTYYGDAATVGAGLPALSTWRRLTRAGDALISFRHRCATSRSANSWNGSASSTGSSSNAAGTLSKRARC